MAKTEYIAHTQAQRGGVRWEGRVLRITQLADRLNFACQAQSSFFCYLLLARLFLKYYRQPPPNDSFIDAAQRQDL